MWQNVGKAKELLQCRAVNLLPRKIVTPLRAVIVTIIIVRKLLLVCSLASGG